MQEESLSMRRLQHAMLFGLELGVYFALCFILSYQASGGMQMLSYLVQIYIIYGVYRSAVHYRQTELGGQMLYRQAFAYLINLFFCASLIASVLRFVYLQWFVPDDFLSNQIHQAMQAFIESGMTITDELERTLADLRRPARFVFAYIMSDMMVGLLVALPLSFLLKRKKN